MAHLPIWYLGETSHEKCDRMIAEMAQLPTNDATMGIDGEEIAHQHRNTAVRFTNFDHWFSEEMEVHSATANILCYWDYEITGREAIQLAEYGPEQHYNWHVDNFPLAGKPTDRKITVVCLLNDPSEFEGGTFQMRLYSEYDVPLVKGSMVAFPSILEHRVTPVLSGKRFSATMWLNGPRFK